MPEKIIAVAKIGAVHGVSGLLKCYSLTEPADNILQYHSWYIKTDKHWQALSELELIKRGSGFFVKVAQCADREKARAYTHALLGVPRQSLPGTKQGEYYWADLEGCAVVTTEGVPLGKVSYLFATGANDVMVLKGERERLLPFIADVVQSVAVDNKEIIVNWDPEF